MSAGPWILHQGWVSRQMNKEIDFDSDTFKLGLAASTSNVGTATVNNYASITNELSTANGYTVGGNTLGSPTIGAGASCTFDTADTVFTASGGSIVARFAFIYDNTDTNKSVIAHCLLDSTPADVTTTTGNTLTIGIANVFSTALS